MKIVLNPKYKKLADFVEHLPFSFENDGDLIYNGRNVLKSFQVEGIDLVVKSFKVPILLNKIAYSCFRKSKAARSYEYGMEIRRRGGNTPEPVAYIEEHKWGMLYRSYYICLNCKDAETVRFYMSGQKQDDALLRSFAYFSADLHERGILHIDYSPGNILVDKKDDGSFEFSLIDINRLCFKKLTDKEAYQSFSRLALSESVSTQLAGWYAEARSMDREEVIREINRYSDSFFRKFALKQAARRLRKEKNLFAVLFGPLQGYTILNWFRCTFLRSARQGCLYEQERTLYLRYIKDTDVRNVLERTFRYGN